MARILPPPDQPLLVCMRQADMDDPTPGSIIDTCQGCQEALWVDPRVLMRIGRECPGETPFVLCIPCALDTPEGAQIARELGEMMVNGYRQEPPA